MGSLSSNGSNRLGYEGEAGRSKGSFPFGGKGLALLVVVLVLFPMLIPVAALVGIIYLLVNRKQKKQENARKAAESAFSTMPAVEERSAVIRSATRESSARPVSQQYGPVGLSRQERLEQLEVLREAGMIEGQEYRDRKRRIMEETQE